MCTIKSVCWNLCLPAIRVAALHGVLMHFCIHLCGKYCGNHMEDILLERGDHFKLSLRHSLVDTF